MKFLTISVILLSLVLFSSAWSDDITMMREAETDSLAVGQANSRQFIKLEEKPEAIISQKSIPVFGKGSFGLTGIENISLSGWSLIPITGVWGYTCYYLKKHCQDLEGNQSEPWTDHHLHLGFIGHLTGVYLKNYQPNFYQNNFGLRLFLNLSWLILSDDAFQHLAGQPNDDYHGPGDSREKIYDSPLGNLYHWLLRPAREDDMLSLGLFDVPLYDRFSISMAYYKGILITLNYSFLRSLFLELNAQFGAVAGYDKTTLSDKFHISGRKIIYSPGTAGQRTCVFPPRILFWNKIKLKSALVF